MCIFIDKNFKEELEREKTYFSGYLTLSNYFENSEMLQKLPKKLEEEIENVKVASFVAVASFSSQILKDL